MHDLIFTDAHYSHSHQISPSTALVATTEMHAFENIENSNCEVPRPNWYICITSPYT